MKEIYNKICKEVCFTSIWYTGDDSVDNQIYDEASFSVERIKYNLQDQLEWIWYPLIVKIKSKND